VRIALVGATGLVGSLLADLLLEREEGPEVHALVRRPTGRSHERWQESVAPSGRWPELVGALAPDAAVSALGTTMRAAGSQSAFRAIDFDAVLGLAAAARQAGARRMVTVSSVGADAASRNFYLRTKGEMEAALRALGFERLDILRPGLLRGPRGGERRTGERIGIVLSPIANLFLQGPLDRYAAIDAVTVAAAAQACLSLPAPGTFVHDNRAIRRLAAHL
jgi:uncharacterized protein YbjT (DUF2867 family)